MKRILILLLVALFAATCSHGQKLGKPRQPSNFFATRINVKQQPDSLTGSYHTLKSGLVLPVYVSSRGNYYVVRRSASGNLYKQYLKPKSI